MKIRRLVLGDRPELRRWLTQAHGEKPAKEMYMAFCDPQRDAVIAEGDDGAPEFYALLTTVQRVDIQFHPFQQNRHRTAKALKALDNFVDKEYPSVKESIFESKVDRLINFMGWLGFRPALGTFSKKRGK
jgi:hypothetical protein